MGTSRFALDRQAAILLVVDIQERLAAAMAERERVEAGARRLIEGARILGVPVVHTEQYPRGIGPTVAGLREALGDRPAVEKITFDCCREPAFLPPLAAAGRKTVVLCGMETHICVLQTCLGLLERGYGVHVAADAVCSRDAANSRVGLELMRDAGAVVTCTETVLFQLLERAGTPEFKAVQQLVK
jgi:nicotinamidase-related amidase